MNHRHYWDREKVREYLAQWLAEKRVEREARREVPPPLHAADQKHLNRASA